MTIIPSEMDGCQLDHLGFSTLHRKIIHVSQSDVLQIWKMYGVYLNIKSTHAYSCLEFAFTANVLPVTINEQHDRYGFVRVKTWALAIRAKHHFLSGSWVQVDATNLPPCLHQSVCKMLVNSATAFPNIAKMIPQSEVSHETY